MRPTIKTIDPAIEAAWNDPSASPETSFEVLLEEESPRVLCRACPIQAHLVRSGTL